MGVHWLLIDNIRMWGLRWDNSVGRCSRLPTKVPASASPSYRQANEAQGNWKTCPRAPGDRGQAGRRASPRNRPPVFWFGSSVYMFTCEALPVTHSGPGCLSPLPSSRSAKTGVDPKNLLTACCPEIDGFQLCVLRQRVPDARRFGWFCTCCVIRA